jgi:hypothetical protein
MKKIIVSVGMTSVLLVACPLATPGQSTGVSGGDTAVSSPDSADDTVVSHTPDGPPQELTREDMLLAQPMPMSGEEREFIFSHKSVQKLHEWTADDFRTYVSSPIGRQILLGEGQRWIDIRNMLRAQARFASDFVAGRRKRPQPLPAKPVPKPAPEDAGAGIDGAPGASSPGYAGDDGGGGTPSMNLGQNKGPDDLFLQDASALEGARGESTFAQLKKVRMDISKYCKELDQLTRSAEQRKLSRQLEEAMSSVSWD